MALRARGVASEESSAAGLPGRVGFDVDMLPSLGDGTEPVPSCARPGAPLAGRPTLSVYRATSAAEVIRLGRRQTSSSPGTPLREP
jgi:hypothetical protein